MKINRITHSVDKLDPTAPADKPRYLREAVAEAVEDGPAEDRPEPPEALVKLNRAFAPFRATGVFGEA